MPRGLPVLLATMLLSLAAGCTTRPVPTGVGTLIEPQDALRLGYTIGTVRHLGLPKQHPVKHTLVFDDMAIVVASPNLVFAVSLRDGTIIWQRSVASSAEHLFKPVRWQDKLLINSETRIYVLSAETGEFLRLPQRLASTVSQGPAKAQHLAIFGGSDGRVFAYDLEISSISWEKHLGGQVVASPVVYGGSAMVTDTTGRCRMYDAMSGEWLWDTRTFGRVVTPPVMTAAAVFIASEDQSLYCVSRSNGSDRWTPYRVSQPLRTSPVLIDNMIFLTVGGEGLHVLDRGTGELLWTFAAEAQPVAMLDKRILLNNHVELLLVEPDKQGEVFMQVPVKPLQSVIHLPGDRLLLISPEGRILRLDPL